MKQNRKSGKIGYRTIFLIICMLFWSIYPFISRLIIKTLPEIEKSYFTNTNGLVIDLLLFCKEISLAVFVAIVILYFIGERIFPDKIEKIDKKRLSSLKLPLIFMGGYAIFSIGSFIFSEYKETAFWGVNSEYEGLLAIISYIAVFIFGIYYLQPQEQSDKKKELAEKKKITATVVFRHLIIILGAITSILALIEIFYKPILEIPFLQDLISSEENRQIARGIKNENFIGQICLTFNNPGFLGGFCALILPVSFSIALEEKAFKKWLCLISDGILILAVKWSDSKVAMVTLIITLPIATALSIYRIRQIKKNEDGTIIKPEEKKKRQIQTIIGFAVVAILGIGLIFASKVLPTYSSRVRPQEETESAASKSSALFKLSKADIEDGVLKLYSGDKYLEVSVDKEVLRECFLDYNEADFADCLIFSDGKNVIKGRVPTTLKKTNIREETPGFKLEDDRYSAISISVDKELIIIDFGYNGTVEFYITSEGIKIFGQGSTLLDSIPQPAVTGLESLYSFGTGRGYLWVQALPILKDSLIFGGGNGTFAFRFRQNEIVGLLNTHSSCKYVIDRPHNWYLQIACSDGVPALLCVLALFILYILKFIKSFFAYKKMMKQANSIKTGSAKNQVSFSDNAPEIPGILDIGLFSGLVGFMLCGFINDSCITVNPLFWLLLGWAVSRQYRKNEQK